MIKFKQKCIWYFSSESSRLPAWRLYIVLKGRKRGRWGSFPFGSILHTHSRHCRRCKGRNLLRDVPVCENVKLSEEQNKMTKQWKKRDKYLVQLAHGGRGRRNDIVYEEEESILGSQVDSFSDEKVKLAHCKKIHSIKHHRNKNIHESAPIMLFLLPFM